MASSSSRRLGHAGLAGRQQQPPQGHQHAGGRAPDVALAVGDVEQLAHVSAPILRERGLVIGGVEQEIAAAPRRHRAPRLRRARDGNRGSTKPTTGVTRKPGHDEVIGQITRELHRARPRPISSCASRSAACQASASCGSMRPPGKLIWPA